MCPYPLIDSSNHLFKYSPIYLSIYLWINPFNSLFIYSFTHISTYSSIRFLKHLLIFSSAHLTLNSFVHLMVPGFLDSTGGIPTYFNTTCILQSEGVHHMDHLNCKQSVLEAGWAHVLSTQFIPGVAYTSGAVLERFLGLCHV